TYVYFGTTIRFDTTHTDAVKRLVINDLDGAELVRLEQAGNILTMSVFGGEARISVDQTAAQERARLAELPEDQRPAYSSANGFTIKGDQSAFSRFNAMPEAAAIPWLSRQLGVLGITGKRSPAALALHRFALKVDPHP